MMSMLMLRRNGALNCNAGCANPGDNVEKPALQNADMAWNTLNQMRSPKSIVRLCPTVV